MGRIRQNRIVWTDWTDCCLITLIRLFQRTLKMRSRRRRLRRLRLSQQRLVSLIRHRLEAVLHRGLLRFHGVCQVDKLVGRLFRKERKLLRLLLRLEGIQLLNRLRFGNGPVKRERSSGMDPQSKLRPRRTRVRVIGLL